MDRDTNRKITCTYEWEATLDGAALTGEAIMSLLRKNMEVWKELVLDEANDPDSGRASVDLMLEEADVSEHHVFTYETGFNMLEDMKAMSAKTPGVRWTVLCEDGWHEEVWKVFALDGATCETGEDAEGVWSGENTLWQ